VKRPPDIAELQIDVERLPDLGAFAVIVKGPLTVWNRHEVRRTVLKCLAEVPAAIIVDLHGVHLVDRIAAAGFVSMRHIAASTGPGVTLLLSGLDDVLLAQRVRALDRTQPIFQDLFEAVAAVREGPVGPRWLWRRLTPGLQAPVEAGVLIADRARTWAASWRIWDFIVALIGVAALRAFDGRVASRSSWSQTPGKTFTVKGRSLAARARTARNMPFHCGLASHSRCRSRLSFAFTGGPVSLLGHRHRQGST